MLLLSLINSKRLLSNMKINVSWMGCESLIKRRVKVLTLDGLRVWLNRFEFYVDLGEMNLKSNIKSHLIKHKFVKYFVHILLRYEFDCQSRIFHFISKLPIRLNTFTQNSICSQTNLKSKSKTIFPDSKSIFWNVLLQTSWSEMN